MRERTLPFHALAATVTPRTSSPSSNSRLDRRRDQRTSRLQLHLLASYRPDSILRAVAGPAGSTSAAEVGHRDRQEVRIGPEVARSQGLAGMGWASRSSHCCLEGLADTAACFGCMGQHLGESVAATGGTAAVRPITQSVNCPLALHVMAPRRVACKVRRC